MLFDINYEYDIIQTVFPDLENVLERSFELENDTSIQEIRLIKSLNGLYSLYDGKISNLDSPEFTNDYLIYKGDLSPFFDDVPVGVFDYVIRRVLIEG